MFKLLLISIVVVPVLLGMVTATSRRQATGLVRLLVLMFAFDVLYLLMVYYLRIRWVG